MEFIIEQDRIYANDAAGKMIAEVTFPTYGDISIIDHTFVDPSLRGQGVAGQLVKLAADTILQRGNKLGVTCPYGMGWFEKHPAYPLLCSGSGCRPYKHKLM